MFMRHLKKGASAASSTTRALSANASLLRTSTKAFRSSNQCFKPEAAGGAYMDQMYNQWMADPSSVDPSWQTYFANGSQATGPANVQQIVAALKASAAGQVGDVSQIQSQGTKLMTLIRAFQTHGHFLADVDPLKLTETFGADFSKKYRHASAQYSNLLDLEYYGFSHEDLDKTYHVDVPFMGGLLSKKKDWTLREIKEALENAYCGKLGVEYMHIPNRDECVWLRDKIELRQYTQVPDDEKILLLDRMFWTDEFANFMGTKFNTMKRFGLEGTEAFIPGMKVIMDTIVENGGEKAIIGMPHRGRLNMLANVVRKPLETLFAEFRGEMPEEATAQTEELDLSGDVKYHLGTSYTRTYNNGKQLTVEVLANPSHLECVNPVVMGRARAENHLKSLVQETEDRNRVVPVLIHGDAAFAGQGVCYESIQMQDLKNYEVGGTIHIIVNNQVGFTTCPEMSRSGIYSSDLAKAVNAPIFHVNADSMDDVSFVFKLAAEYRQKFNHDVVIDLIGYRKFGHNELDQPAFTQPQMYQQVAKMEPVARIYEKQLIEQGVITADRAEEMKKTIRERLETSYNNAKDHKFNVEDWITDEWEGIKKIDQTTAKISGLSSKRLLNTGRKIATLPEDENFHRQVKKIFEARLKSIETGKAIDWGTAEALAFGTLVEDGYNVRISGQDVERGTFSHRHAHVFYQDKNGYYNPINNVLDVQHKTRRFIASNSHLSEFAVLGYELGYAQTHPNTLTLWEAQFGDFANGAQVIIDQFISSGESKWNVKNGLVMLLPHGYDGQGPEHSSSRLERYLQLCNQDEFVPGEDYDNKDILRETNMQVVMPSTSANYFHLLRTHMRMPYRKPVVVVAPKKLLKFKGAACDIHEFSEDTRFWQLMHDRHPNLVAPEKVKKVIICAGQVYYDLEAHREKIGCDDVAILRAEQLCPFPFKEIIERLKVYKNASVTWAQEEPKNQGTWTYAQPRLRNIMKHLNREAKVSYAGRPYMAATATGYTSVHNEQLDALLKQAFE